MGSKDGRSMRRRLAGSAASRRDVDTRLIQSTLGAPRRKEDHPIVQGGYGHGDRRMTRYRMIELRLVK